MVSCVGDCDGRSTRHKFRGGRCAASRRHRVGVVDHRVANHAERVPGRDAIWSGACSSGQQDEDLHVHADWQCVGHRQTCSDLLWRTSGLTDDTLTHSSVADR